MHRELPDLVLHPQDVAGNVSGQTNFCRPPPKGHRSGFYQQSLTTKHINECVSLTGSAPIWPRGCPWCGASSRLCSRCRTSFPVASRCSNIPDGKQQDRTHNTASCPLRRTNTQVNSTSTRRSSTIRPTRRRKSLTQSHNVGRNGNDKKSLITSHVTWTPVLLFSAKCYRQWREDTEAADFSWLGWYRLKWCCTHFPNIQWQLADLFEAQRCFVFHLETFMILTLPSLYLWHLYYCILPFCRTFSVGTILTTGQHQIFQTEV